MAAKKKAKASVPKEPAEAQEPDVYEGDPEEEVEPDYEAEETEENE